MVVRRFSIKPFERGLRFVDGVFKDILGEGAHWYFDPFREVRVDVLNVRDPWIAHADLDVIVRRGVLSGEATVVELDEHERALVWIDGRLDTVLMPGLYALWTVSRFVIVEVLDANAARLAEAEVQAVSGPWGPAKVPRRS